MVARGFFISLTVYVILWILTDLFEDDKESYEKY